MKKLLSLFLALIATAAIWAGNVITYTATAKLREASEQIPIGFRADSCDVVIISHEFSDGVGTITFSSEIRKIGGYAFSGCSGLTSVTIPNSVTTIGNYAFSSCSRLNSITIPNSVTTIGDYAFTDCSGLTSVIIPNSVTTIGCHIFYGCSGLTSPIYNINNFAYMPQTYSGAYTIPNGIKQIAGGAFRYCSGLTSVSIPNSVTTIEWGAFSDCTGLISVTIPNSVTTIEDNAFYNVNNIVYNGTSIGSPWGAKCVNGYVDGYLVYSDANKTTLCGCSTAASGVITIPNSVTTIGNYAFYRCSGLTSIIIPNSVTTIGGWTFYGCSGLTSITIPNSVTTIGESAFDGCSGLTSVTIPNSVTTIGNYAFSSCSRLNSITIPNSVTTIGSFAFSNCQGLISVDLGSSVTTIGSSAFSYCINLSIISFPNSITTVGNDIFYNCRNLTSPIYNNNVFVYMPESYAGSYSIPYGIKKINGNSFQWCNLTSITIPNTVITIGDYAFSYCKMLSEITIPSSVCSIGTRAFEGCTRIKSIISEAITPPSCGEECFYRIDKSTSVCVPYNSIDLYKQTDVWKEFTNIHGPANEITYIARYQLVEKQVSSPTGFRPDAFGSQIISHEFDSNTKQGYIVFEENITEIGDSAFYGCENVISLTIPNSVNRIGNKAFSGIVNVNYSGSAWGSPWEAKCVNGYLEENLLYRNSSKTSLLHCMPNVPNTISIPNTVIEIEESAFEGSEITSITIPSSVTKIGKSAFSNCSKLTKTNFTGTISDWCKVIFEDSKANPIFYSNNLYIKNVQVTDLKINSVSSISDAAFYNCNTLTSITCREAIPPTCGATSFMGVNKSIPLSVPYQSLASYKAANVWKSFTNIMGINTIITYHSIKKLPETTVGAFGYNALYVKAFNVPILSHTFSGGVGQIAFSGEVTSIGDWAFHGCSDITNIDIPESVITIGKRAFGGCSKLVSIILPDSISSIGEEAFSGCSKLNSINIPSTVSTIGKGAFGFCEKIVTIVIPQAVTTIAESTFQDCYNLSVVTLGDSVTTIGDYAFDNCYGLWNIVLPSSLTSIGRYAFDGCTGLFSLNIPNALTSIEYNAFRSCTRLTKISYENYFMMGKFDFNFPAEVTNDCYTPIKTSFNNQQICSVNAITTFPSMYLQWYDEVGLCDETTSSALHNAANLEGDVIINHFSVNKKHYHFYAKKGSQIIYKEGVDIVAKTPSFYSSPTSTQTTITFSNIYASTDESVKTLTKGIYYNGQCYKADNNNCVILKNLAPNQKYIVQHYGCYNGEFYYGSDMSYSTQSLDPKITISQVSPTSVYAKGLYTNGDATILGSSFSSILNVISPEGDEGYFTGFHPDSIYVLEYIVNTKEGGTYTAAQQVTTSKLEITTLVPKIVSAGTAVVAAETNISDFETNVGFEWRKYDAPESMPSKSGAAILYNGMMEGKLLNLGTDSYWNVRPYYEAADGTRYYGEWITFDPNDFSYFEPTVHTYALATSPTANKVQVRGYVMTGTDDVTEQGFEYWFKGGQKAPHRIPNATADSVYRVTASGQVMTAVLEDLAYSSTYTCRAYAIAGGKTYYGEEVQFLTPEDPRPIYTLTVIAGENGSVNTEVSGQYREGEQVTLTATPNVGYLFKQWSDGNTENPYILTIMQDTEITATFKQAESGLTNLHSDIRATKYFYNGNLFIERNGIKYTPTGQKVR